ncbi:MAG: CHAT domain-containing tetratricopeptide repeat protein [Acidobacteriota bacterium]
MTLARAQEAVQGSRPAEALELLESILPVLRTKGHPYFFEALYWKAASYFALSRYELALETTEDLSTALDGREFSALASRASFLRGLNLYVIGEPAKAHPILRAAVDSFPKYGPKEELAYSHVLLGECLFLLGDVWGAWKHYHQAVYLSAQVWSPYRRVQILNALADLTLRQGDIALSFRYQDAAVTWAATLGNESFLADVLNWRSILFLRMGQPERAIKDWAEARNTIRTIEDPVRYQLALADSSLIKGLLLAADEPHQAIEELTAAVAAYEAERHWSNLLLAVEARAESYRRSENRTEALADLERAIELYELLGDQALDESFRIALGPRIESAFDQLVHFELDQGRDKSALLYYMRGREMTHPNSTSYSEPVADFDVIMAEIQASLSDDVVLVAFGLLVDRVVVWEIRRDHLAVHQSGLDPAPLIDLVKPGAHRRAGRREASSKLFEALVRPWFRPSDRAAILVPDKAIFHLPFAALHDSSTGRFLVESLRISLSPTPQWLLSRREHLQVPHRGLLVADPAFNKEVYPGLSRLPGARRVGKQLHRLLQGSHLQSSETATVDHFLGSVAEATFLHFSGHATASVSRPLQSSLLFAPSPDFPKGAVSGQHLLETNLQKLRFVNLSACRTGASLPGQWAGSLPLVRPFLQAGVPVVVGTLWNIDDLQSARFTHSFYLNLSDASHNPVEAFHQAQLSAFQSSMDPLEDLGWAAHVLFGAFTDERSRSHRAVE